MSASTLKTVVRNLGRSLLHREVAELTDGELLERFILRRDEVAFEGLVRRHGAMVLAACRRVLGREADAEDAFQATFLVLARKAGSIRPRGMVGNWLYGVAHNTARKARAMSIKQHERERQAAAQRRHAAPDGSDWRELHELLDQELQALPDHYRASLVLCDLEGKSIKEAARQLGCPLGTVGTRLARGRTLLAKRLAARGVAISVGLVAARLAEQTATAALAPLLVRSTVEAAALVAAGQQVAGVVAPQVTALAEGVVKSMLLHKLSFGAVLIALGVALGAGVWGSRGSAALAEPAVARRAALQGKGAAPDAPITDKDPETKPAPEETAKQALERLQGAWLASAGGEFRGQIATAEEVRKAGHRWVVKGDQFAWYSANLNDQGRPFMEGTIRIVPGHNPKAFDLVFLRDGLVATGKCIYHLEGETLRFCYDEPERPKIFKTHPENGSRLYVWQREPGSGKKPPPEVKKETK